jgi:hypothetical protein
MGFCVGSIMKLIQQNNYLSTTYPNVAGLYYINLWILEFLQATWRAVITFNKEDTLRQMSEVGNYQYHFIWKLILQYSGVNNVVYDYVKCHIVLNIFQIYISQHTVTHNTINKSLRWQVSAYYRLSKGVSFWEPFNKKVRLQLWKRFLPLQSNS